MKFAHVDTKSTIDQSRMWKGCAALWVWICFICKLFTMCAYPQISTCHCIVVIS